MVGPRKTRAGKTNMNTIKLVGTMSVHIRHRGRHQGWVYFDRQKELWVHEQRAEWFKDTPVLMAKTLSEIERLIMRRGEQLINPDSKGASTLGCTGFG
jgi:hypothetical protein